MAGLHELQQLSLGGRGRDIHITSNARISVDPPRSSQTRLSVKHAELIKAQFLLQATCQRNARFSSTHDDDGVVGIGIFIISIDKINRIREICNGYRQ